jgi:hypothetical protein
MKASVMNDPDNIDPRQKPNPGYETQDLNVRLIVTVSFIALFLMIVALYVINEIFVISKEKRLEHVVLTPTSTKLRELRSQEDEALTSYKIIDSDKGIYQIPIEQAMKILANQAYQKRQNIIATPKDSDGNPKAP